MDDIYHIPSVPQFKRDLNVDLDDTIGDEFFEKMNLCMESPAPPPPKPVQRRSVAPPGNRNSNAPVPPVRNGVRRSLMKPGRPSVSCKPVGGAETNDKDAQLPVKVPSPSAAVVVEPTTPSPLKSPVGLKVPMVTRSQAHRLVQPKLTNGTLTTGTTAKLAGPSQSTFHTRPTQQQLSLHREPPKVAGLAANTRVRRSLMKPGRPSVGSLPADNKENQQPVVAKVADAAAKPTVPPVFAPAFKSPPKAPVTRSQTYQLSASATKAMAAGVSSFLNRLHHVQPTAIPSTPKGPAANTRRRSFMDPTISSASKFNTAA